MKNILVIRFSSLGDIILTSAPVLNLKINYPESHLVYLTKEPYRKLVSGFEGVDEVVTLKKDSGPTSLVNLLNRLDNYHFDLVVDWHGSLRSWFSRKYIVADRKIVYPKRRVERVRIVKSKKIPRHWPHTIDLYNSIFDELKGHVYCKRPVLNTHRWGDDKKPVLKPGFKYIFIAPGAAHPNKQWPMEKFAEVAFKLYQPLKTKIIWCVLSNEAGKSGLNKRIPTEDFIELVDYPLHEIASIIKQTNLVISNDSGLMHLASSVGTPVIAIFGPTHPALGFSPRGLFDKILEVDEYCRPCSLHGKKPCFRDKQYCFTRIEPEQVITEANRIIKFETFMAPAVFLDRDGTVIVDKDYLSDPDDIKFEHKAVEALKVASEKGYKIIVISNQSGVARGYFDIDTVEKVNARFLELLSANGIDIDGLFYCPYYEKGEIPEFSIFSEDRKPGPGMVEEAVTCMNIDPCRSFIIGDKFDDYNLGRVTGIMSYLVKTGHGKKTEEQLHRYRLYDNKRIFNNVYDAIKSLPSVTNNE